MRRANYDTPWKEVLDSYFQAFLEYCYPHIAQEIDWARGYESLEQELRVITRSLRTGKRIIDKLLKAWHIDGSETWFLFHVEVQGQHDPEFDKRMYVYNYRLYDKYQKPIVSLAILTDPHDHWRPNGFEQSLFGCSIRMTFPVIKLLDYRKRVSELAQTTNPFGVVILAQLAALETRKDTAARFTHKLALTRRLYEKGLDKTNILQLYQFIDWILALPPALEVELQEAITQLEEETQMRYITSAERIGIKKGIEQGIEQGEATVLRSLLQLKFGQLPAQYAAQIDQANAKTLLQWAENILEAQTVAEVFAEE